MAVHNRRWIAQYQGREYVFCSEGCRALFVQDPAARLSGKGERQHYDMITIASGESGHATLSAGVYLRVQ